MKNFMFNLFTRKIEVKIKKNDEGDKRITFLVKKLMKEMEDQGMYKFEGDCKIITIYEHKNYIVVEGSDYSEKVRINKSEDNPCTE